MLLQIIRHRCGQVFRVVVEHRLPAIDSVQLQEYARCRVVVAVRMFVCTLIKLGDIQFADLTLVAERIEVTVFLITRAEAVF